MKGNETMELHEISTFAENIRAEIRPLKDEMKELPRKLQRAINEGDAETVRATKDRMASHADRLLNASAVAQKKLAAFSPDVRKHFLAKVREAEAKFEAAKAAIEPLREELKKREREALQALADAEGAYNRAYGDHRVVNDELFRLEAELKEDFASAAA